MLPIARIVALSGVLFAAPQAPAAIVAPPVPSPGTRDGTVYVLLHGLDSDETVWNDVSTRLFGRACVTVEPGATGIVASKCYRYHFSDGIWPHGDGLTYAELGDEVRAAVAVIESANRPAALVLVGHSRGGLAARSYVQTLSSQPPFKLGLVTIGSPHQGSPLGRIKPWMDSQGKTAKDVPALFRDELRFVFSPSTGYLATRHTPDRGLACRSKNPNSIGFATCELNRAEKLAALADRVSAFGQITSKGLVLGEKAVAGELDLLNGISVASILPGNFQKMRAFVLQNLVRKNRDNFCNGSEKRDTLNWACNGDGAVPWISQNLQRLLNGTGHPKTFAKVGLNKVPHSEQPERTRDILNVLNALPSIDPSFGRL